MRSQNNILKSTPLRGNVAGKVGEALCSTLQCLIPFKSSDYSVCMTPASMEGLPCSNKSTFPSEATWGGAL